MVTLNSVMMGTSQPKLLAEFYEKVFDRKPDMVDGGFSGWVFNGFWFTFGEHSEVPGKSKEPARYMFNLETTEVKKEFERIKGLGAEVIKEPYEMGGGWIATFADPDGNYFQLVTPWQS